MFRFIFVLMLLSCFSVVAVADDGLTVGYFDPNSGRVLLREGYEEKISIASFEELKGAGPGATLIIFDDGRKPLVLSPVSESRTNASKQTEAVLLTERQSQALAFRGEAVATYADREADQSAKDWYRLEQDSRITDARIRQAEIDSEIRLRQQQLRERESSRRAYEQSARRREEVRRNREAEELRERQQAQRERQQAVNNAKVVTREVVTIIERAKKAQK